ncbi:TonB-dependent receptor plug domain-containing protein [Aequorivita marina]|uniref:TonB-dependent receptor plug domain-containing protein n=1 Tax=Aequorivita marina TaxID=3073654 RepID=UPI00287482D6|nr:TonB-dependent receptor plug domain-containing protein [Aequorivita sp. S2608]MDS1299130.1 TonB-dependent receptor plug domain-containing protein [Aequorivita sp. S2608]
MRKILLLIICLLCLAFTFNSDSGLKTLINKRLNEYTKDKYPEKIYIHTDRPYYTAGESIWFSSYLVNGVTHVLSGKSSVVYVELINRKDEVLIERKLFAEAVSVQGDFKLPIDLEDGVYTLRAYTNYMRNQSRAYFFKKKIPVFALNSELSENLNNQDSETSEQSALPNIGFYPEGGYLVNGLISKVAVKIKDAKLSASPIVGIIEDTEGNKVSDFKTFEFGLGFFYLKPELGKEYRAVISSGDENITYSLPKPIEEGYVINTSTNNKELVINVETNKKEGLKNVLIIGHQRGIQAFDYSQDIQENTMLIKIPKKDLIEGILDIVVFNNDHKPVAERLAFIKKEEETSISVKKTNGSQTTTRDRVNLKVEVKDKAGKLVPSTLSMSVTDINLIKSNNNAENIKTYLLLNSDLRGKIKSPNYFFTEGNEIKKNEQLDLIMLTHGWRRFTWQEFLENSLPLKYKPEDGIYISGNTQSAKSPFQNKISETKLTLRKTGFYQETQTTSSRGHFKYGPFVFQDTIDVFLEAGKGLLSKKPDLGNTNIVLDKPVKKPSIIPDRILSPFKFESENATIKSYKRKSRNNVFRDFQFDKDRERLDEVQLKGKIKKKEEIAKIKRDKRTRSFEPSHRVIVSEMGQTGAGDFMQLLMNIPGIRIGRKQGRENQTSQDFEVNLRGMKPTFYLDDVEVNLLTARSVHQADIDFIDVMNTGHASAAYGLKAQGVIAIYTKQGSRSTTSITDKKPGSISFKAEGFYTAREFYAPDYSLVDRNRNKIDSRSTLYWNPIVKTQGYKNADVTFYTSDEKGTYQIEIEGITHKGVPFHATSYLEVE